MNKTCKCCGQVLDRTALVNMAIKHFGKKPFTMSMLQDYIDDEELSSWTYVVLRKKVRAGELDSRFTSMPSYSGVNKNAKVFWRV